MGIYKPFDLLYSSIETFYNKTGVGANNFFSDPPVVGLIATLQLFNVITIMSLLSYFTSFSIRYLYIIIGYGLLIVINFLYFKDSRTEIILSEFGSYASNEKILINICTILYIILSFVLMVITYNK
jgi:hypothetical protein